MSSAPAVPPTDDKDWTWVLREPCPECGFDAAALQRADIPGQVRAGAAVFRAALARPDAARRPQPQVWSPLEYACHVRDVCRVFAERLRLMLTEDDPLFANWDQDETALAERYWTQDPAVVSAELAEAAERIADGFAGVHGEQWERPSRRSNGSVFTVDTFGRYFVHDVVHHVHDIGVHDIGG
jgi:hypothetical protein